MVKKQHEHDWEQEERILSRKEVSNNEYTTCWIYIVKCSTCNKKAEIISYKRNFDEALINYEDFFIF